MPEAKVNGIVIHYVVHGAEDGTPILLISGVGTQMTSYRQSFIDELVGRGYRVVQMDNRDIGLSQKFTDHGLPDFAAATKARVEGRVDDNLAYQLSDMADDCVALLAHLGIKQAHILGSSMGGMIAQLVAIRHPDVTLTLTSIMSNSGNPDLPRGTPEAMAALTTPRPDPKKDLDAFIAHGVNTATVIGSPKWPIAEEVIRERIKADYERSFHPTGFPRQYAAILATPDRRPDLAKLTLPVLVIHGVQDPLVPIAGGRDTAKHVPGAELLEIDGMGHNIPPEINAMIADAVDRVVARA